MTERKFSRVGGSRVVDPAKKDNKSDVKESDKKTKKPKEEEDKKEGGE